MGSGSDETGMGVAASSAVVSDVDAGCRRAGSGGEGACSVLRHIALVEVSGVPNIAAAGSFDIPFPFRNWRTIRIHISYSNVFSPLLRILLNLLLAIHRRIRHIRHIGKLSQSLSRLFSA
jgi:hypothetical protein